MNLGQDLMFAVRRMRKTPGLTAAAVISIALGIAANSTIFSMARALLLNSSPVGNPSSALSLYSAYGDCCTSFSQPLYEDVRDQAKSFSGVAAHFPLMPVAISGQGDPMRTWGQAVTTNFFDVIQVHPALGRTFAASEAKANVAILSHELWQTRFHADPAITGKPVLINSQPFTVVGVMPAGFHGIDLMFTSALWVPLDQSARILPKSTSTQERGSHWLEVTARLKPGVSQTQAEAELRGLAKRFAQAYPKIEKELQFRTAAAGALNPSFTRAVRLFIAGLSVVVFLVLCIACANVANLLLAQAVARQREMAIRLAIGASRLQLIRQLLIESLILALCGAGVGVALTLWSTQALSSFDLPIPIPVQFVFSVDPQVLAYTLALSAVTALLFGLAPAWLATRPVVSDALKGEMVQVRMGRRFALRHVLVVGQVTASLLLMCLTGLFLRSLQTASSLDIGFRSNGVALIAIDPPQHGYTPDRTRQFLHAAMDRASRIPGVQAAAVSDIVPLSIGGVSTGFKAEGKSTQDRTADCYAVSSRYFETLSIPIVRGRSFTIDTTTSARVAVVNEMLAHALFGDGNPVGQRIRSGELTYEIVGLVKNTKSRTLGEDARPVVYRFLDQEIARESSFLGYTLMVQTSGSAGAAVQQMRREIAAMDPNMATSNEETMREHLNKALFLPKLVGALFGVFGTVGLLLAIVGLYGVMSYSVSRRTREIGIRMALGAESRGILQLVLREGFVLTAIAMIAGLALALAAAKLTSSLLYGVSPYDLFTFIAVPVLLALIAGIACLIPARRASQVEPVRALHYE